MNSHATVAMPVSAAHNEGFLKKAVETGVKWSKRLLPAVLRHQLRLLAKRTGNRLLHLAGQNPAVQQPAFFVNRGGILKLRPDLAARMHQNPSVFAVEAGTILQFYRGGVHLDIGCGSRKITAAAIGIDITDGSAPYVVGGVNVVTSADNLYPFKDDAIDFISCIHSFEHYDNPKAVLKEWLRVLKVAGRIGIVVPARNGLIPDKDLLGAHKFDYDARALEALVSEFGGSYKILALDTLQNGWSIDLVIEKHDQHRSRQ